MDKKKDPQDFKVIHCTVVAGCTAYMKRIAVPAAGLKY